MKNWHDLSDEYTITVNSEAQSYRADITIGVEVIALPEQYIFHYMDENHLELGTDSFAPEEVPQTLYPSDGTAYILVEETGQRRDGTKRTFRTIYSKEQSVIAGIYVPVENDICIKGSTAIVW